MDLTATSSNTSLKRTSLLALESLQIYQADRMRVCEWLCHPFVRIVER